MTIVIQSKNNISIKLEPIAFEVVGTDSRHWTDRITIERRGPGDCWAVARCGNVLDKHGFFRFEPQSPADRTPEFIETTRCTFEEAQERVRDYLALGGADGELERIREVMAS